MLKIENHLDLDSLLARTDGDMNLVAEVFDIFWENLPDQLSTLREAIDRNDAREVMTSAHSLKGSLGNLSAHAAHDAALALENAGRQRQARPGRTTPRCPEKRAGRLENRAGRVARGTMIPPGIPRPKGCAPVTDFKSASAHARGGNRGPWPASARTKAILPQCGSPGLSSPDRAPHRLGRPVRPPGPAGGGDRVWQRGFSGPPGPKTPGYKFHRTRTGLVVDQKTASPDRPDRAVQYQGPATRRGTWPWTVCSRPVPWTASIHCFPPPWPKEKHIKRRLFHQGFLQAVCNRLVSGRRISDCDRPRPLMRMDSGTGPGIGLQGRTRTDTGPVPNQV